jgi:hypothetical protein
MVNNGQQWSTMVNNGNLVGWLVGWLTTPGGTVQQARVDPGRWAGVYDVHCPRPQPSLPVACIRQSVYTADRNIPPSHLLALPCLLSC